MKVCINLYPLRPGMTGGIESFSRYIVRNLAAHPDCPEVDVMMPAATGGGLFGIHEIDIMEPRWWAKAEPRPAPPPATPIGKLYRSANCPAWVRAALQWAHGRVRRPGAGADLELRARLEAGGYDVIHCPYQAFHPAHPTSARIPYVFHLHDLQHEHFPQFFSRAELASRRRMYRLYARQAGAVVCAAEHVRRDILKYCEVEAEKVFMVQWGPPEIRPVALDEATRARVREKYRLPARFMLYPAAMWEHKNHLRLLEAMALLRGRGVRTHLVCTRSAEPEFQARVFEAVGAHDLRDAFTPLGYLPIDDLRVLFELADFLVIPSLHEESSGPLMEAMTLGRPVACADIADHAELVGDACPLFDPLDVEGMAAAIERLAQDDAYRLRCGERGRERIHQARSWDRFVRELMQVYHYAAERQ